MKPLALLAAGCALLAGFVQAQGTPEVAPLRLHVAIDGETMTLVAQDVSIEHLLREISRQSGIEVHLDAPLDQRLTLAFDHLPVPEALHRILRGRNFVLRYVDRAADAGTSGGAPSNSLWIYATPGSGERRGDVVSPETRAADKRMAHLHRALADPDRKVRLDAVAELTEMDGERAAEALAEAALSADDPSVRAEAVYALGEIGAEIGRATVAQALSDPDPGVREAAIEACADLGRDDAAWTLASALDDPDPALREQAVYALETIGGEVATGLVERSLADPRPSVREAAAEVLEELSGRAR